MDDKKDSEMKVSTEITGKKIFFLYPTGSMQNQIVTELVQQEFEVYVVKDHSRLFKVLKKYPDSIVYVNIDEGMPQHEWERWIAGTMNSIKEVKFGIFSSTSDEKVREKYLKNIKVTCGFIGLKVDMSKSVSKLLEVLNVLNVKGRRKYLRASTERETTATINMPVRGDFVKGAIRDISVVGISCVFEHDPGLKKNELVKDIQLKLQSMLLKVEAVIFGSREEAGQTIYVLLFTQRIDPDIRVKIRKYVQHNLQQKMNSELG